ncbi:unnamed protein product, partial [Didymodactylos carnosus]
KDLEDIIYHHDMIKEEVQALTDKASKSNPIANNIIRQIEDWKNEMMGKIQAVANEAKQDVQRLLQTDDLREDIVNRLKSIKQQLREGRETESYVEHDLERWKLDLDKLKKDLNQKPKPLDIHVNTEESRRITWGTLIKVKIVENEMTQSHISNEYNRQDLYSSPVSSSSVRVTSVIQSQQPVSDFIRPMSTSLPYVPKTTTDCTKKEKYKYNGSYSSFQRKYHASFPSEIEFDS